VFTGKFTNGYIENQKNVDAIAPNVRRYVQLAQNRGGACFCTRGAKQGYEVVLFILALAKTVTPAGVPGGSRGGLHRH
jgi:ribosomal protein RSM22 (predicted rRNA methylase)